MKKSLSLLVIISLIGCSSNQVGFSSEVQYATSGARPGVEQRALSYAVESAFENVNFNVFQGKTGYVEVQGLADKDLEFIKIYITNRIITSGGRVYEEKEKSEYNVSMVINVLGGDKMGTNYYLFSTEKLVEEFTGRFSVISKDGEVIINQYLSSQQSERLR